MKSGSKNDKTNRDHRERLSKGYQSYMKTLLDAQGKLKSMFNDLRCMVHERFLDGFVEGVDECHPVLYEFNKNVFEELRPIARKIAEIIHERDDAGAVRMAVLKAVFDKRFHEAHDTHPKGVDFHCLSHKLQCFETLLKAAGRSGVHAPKRECYAAKADYQVINKFRLNTLLVESIDMIEQEQTRQGFASLNLFFRNALENPDDALSVMEPVEDRISRLNYLIYSELVDLFLAMRLVIQEYDEIYLDLAW